LSFKLLVVGSGFLGLSLEVQAKVLGMSVTGTHRVETPQVDIRNENSIEKIILRTKPDYVINSAALTNVDDIEKQSEEAYSINAYGAKNLANISKKYKVPLLHISTDSVFDGRNGIYSESDVPNPVNEYGKSKLLGEKLILEVLDSAIIIRTNFYGYNDEGKFLFNWILQKLQQHKHFNAFGDVIFNPLEITNLSQMIMELINVTYSGIIHLSSDHVMSKYQFACEIADNLNLDKNLIHKVNLVEEKLFAARPLNTTLSNNKAKKLLKTKEIPFKEWIQTYSQRKI
jgi:dTDP-4-dehydrorhamnose reductase